MNWKEEFIKLLEAQTFNTNSEIQRWFRLFRSE